MDGQRTPRAVRTVGRTDRSVTKMAQSGTPRDVAVVGAGRMGAGIGLVFASGGARVTFLVRDVRRARDRVASHIDELRELRAIGEDLALHYEVVDSMDDLPECDLIVESVPEDVGLKSALLEPLSKAYPDAIIGTNTSSLPITDLAKSVTRPERFLGTHFWYPPMLMPLVELVPGSDTSADAMDMCEAFLGSCGKVPVRLRQDYPGFLWNRLQVAVLREAKHLVEAGVADPSTVDLVVEQGLARRWAITGPLASAKLGGIPTFEAVGRNLLPLLSDAGSLDGLGDALRDYVTDPAALDRARNAALAETPTSPRRAR